MAKPSPYKYGGGTARVTPVKAKVKPKPKGTRGAVTARALGRGAGGGGFTVPAYKAPVIPDIPEYDAGTAPTLKTTEELRTAARQYVDEVYAPQRELINQQ